MNQENYHDRIHYLLTDHYCAKYWPSEPTARQIYAAIKTKQVFVVIQAPDGTHSQGFATREEAYAEVARQIGRDSEDWKELGKARINGKWICNHGRVIYLSEYDAEKTLADIWDQLDDAAQSEIIKDLEADS